MWLWVPATTALLRLLLVLSVLNEARAALTCGTCEGGSSLTCPSSLDMQYTVSSYAYEASQFGALILKCDYYTVPINLTMMQGCSFPNVIYVKIEQCPLFNESIASVLSKLGVNADIVRFLLWETSHSVGDGLQTWHLEGLHNLTWLQIQNNEFTSFPTGLLQHTPLLQKLYVTGNRVSQLPSDFLSYTPQIVNLDLGTNQLESLPENFLKNVPLLEVLNLWTNQLTSIPPRLFSTTPLLSSVLLRSNNLTVLDNRLFARLGMLRSIDLQVNKLQTLPELIFQGCANLTLVDLQYNEITQLPSNLFNDTALVVLNVGYNKLTNISGVLNNIPTLTNVSIHKNQLQSLSGDVFLGTTNLVRLDLQANKIVHITAGIFNNLSKMKIIFLNNNLINVLPSGLLRNCNSLMKVFMQNNNISVLPSDTFPEYSDMTKLDLSYNRLTFKESVFNPLNKLASLEEINLSHNNISMVFNEVLYVFTRLKLLDLSYNSINLLTDHELVFLSKNVTFKVQNNNISTIMAGPHLGLVTDEKLLVLELAGNPLKCDCKMHAFLEIAQLKPPFAISNQYNVIIPDADQTICFETKTERNVSLSKVDRTKLVCEFKCSLECPCSIRLHDNFILMDCSDLGLSNPPTFTDIFHSTRKNFNLSLDLSNNEYEYITFLNEIAYNNLINLDLNNNTISDLNATMLPSTLRFLDLSMNNFTAMSVALVERLNSSGMSLHLGGNPWTCDCGLKSFHDFLRDNYELVSADVWVYNITDNFTC